MGHGHRPDHQKDQVNVVELVVENARDEQSGGKLQQQRQPSHAKHCAKHRARQVGGKMDRHEGHQRGIAESPRQHLAANAGHQGELARHQGAREHDDHEKVSSEHEH